MIRQNPIDCFQNIALNLPLPLESRCRSLAEIISRVEFFSSVADEAEADNLVAVGRFFESAVSRSRSRAVLIRIEGSADHQMVFPDSGFHLFGEIRIRSLISRGI